MSDGSSLPRIGELVRPAAVGSPHTPSASSDHRSPAALAIEPLVLPGRWERLLVRVKLARRGSASRLPRLGGASDVYREFAGLASLDREAFLALLVDQKNRVTGVHTVSVGSLSASLVHPREVFKAAILGNAAALVVLHNHPSGDPTPSREDREITTRLRICGETLGIPLLDHVIVASDGYRSFAESGWL